MKSKSHYNDNCDHCKKDKKEKRKKCPAIIKCGNPGTATIPDATVVGTTFTPTSLTLDTSSLCNPCTKLKYTSNVVFTGDAGFTGSISFQVFKQCNNQFTPIPVGPAFTLSSVTPLGGSSTFTFFICDCDSCNNDCCTYTVVATVNAITVGTLSINNATLKSISTCQVCNSN